MSLFEVCPYFRDALFTVLTRTKTIDYYVRVTERYTETLHVKKMADL